mmetsp:Transcript_5140/g.9437  ORF Transcript_5140/g.9437 Transcript_5140/m.9437 type:complete len:266 (+) Transcript_5140:103-900(+)
MPRLVLLLLGAPTLLFLLQPFRTTGFTPHHPPLQGSVLNKKQASVVSYPDSACTIFKSIHSRTTTTTASTSTTRLYALLDVPDNFFTILLPTLSLFLAFSKAVARSRLEERAWEQRLEESRSEQLERDLGQTEIELRTREAAAEWMSAYGRNFNPEEKQKKVWNNKRKRVVTREQTSEPAATSGGSREYNMSPQEIENFEREFGVEYDPYYDDPYTEEDLPEDIPYKVDKVYGDRIYKDGEVFYKDDNTGLYYRQGSHPRTQKFW